MTRINTNVPSLVAQNRLQSSNGDLQTALTRLSTGLRINSGADDPAGLIASEALRSEITSLGKAITNTRRASQIISTADSALGEVSSLLNDIRGLVVEAANSGALSDEEIAANQLQIDSSLEAINRIAQTTTFQGRKLLDGSLDFISNAGSVSSLKDIKIDQANLGATGKIDAEIVINAAATQAVVSAGAAAFTASSSATASIADSRSASQVIGDQTLDITGTTDFATIAFVDDVNNANTGTASFDENTGVLTITANFTGDSNVVGETDANVDAQVIQTAINNIEGFSATGATGPGTREATATQVINGESIDITGGSSFTSIAFVDDTNNSNTGAASFDSGTGILTITGNFTGDSLNVGEVDADASATVIQGLINGLNGFTATGATAAGTPAAPSAATVTPVAAETPATVDPAAAGLSITATNAGSAYNNVAINFVSGTSTSADFDSEQKILTVTIDSAAPQSTSSIATAIDAATVDGATPAAALFSATGSAALVDITAGIDSLDTGSTGGEVLNDSIVLQLNGASGAETFNFGSGTSASQIAAAVNLVSDSTGVSSAFTSASGLTFTSTAYGSDALVNVDVVNEGSAGTFGSSLSALRQTGTDISATVNGVEASGDANTLSINTSSLDLTVTVDDGSSTNFSFSITGGGALFQLGPDVTSNQQARLGIGSLSTGQLGGASGRLYELGSGQAKSLINDVNGAAEVIDDVIDKVTGLRGRLGAFQSTTLESNLVSLNETLANLQEAESSIRDADFAQESANLTRAQILVQSGTNVLSLANQNPQNVLSLLR